MIDGAPGRRTVHLSTLIEPLAPISESAQDVHGIREEDLREKGASFADIAPQLEQILRSDHVEAVGAYNASFDRKKLLATAEAAGRPEMKPAIRECNWKDLIEPVTEHLGEEDYLPLAKAASEMGVSTAETGVHRAAEDADLARRVWAKLKSENEV